MTVGSFAGTTYVVTRGNFYALEPGVTPEDFDAWWAQKDAKREQTLARVRAAANGSGVGRPDPRRAIPKDARVLVWQRDRGACVECGSSENLEFDHIIPVSMGGANTARNLQLLCETCNRAKGGNLV